MESSRKSGFSCKRNQTPTSVRTQQHPQQHDKSQAATPRKFRNVITSADHDLLLAGYTFVPPPPPSNPSDAKDSSPSSTWQERMIQRYHQGLYKEFALADLTTRPGTIGLRWRTRTEVLGGRGEITCGNKHCPVLTNGETLVPLTTVEVPFAYTEHGIAKKELVKLRLCRTCRPLLRQSTSVANLPKQLLEKSQTESKNLSTHSKHRLKHCKSNERVTYSDLDSNNSSSSSSSSSSSKKRTVRSVTGNRKLSGPKHRHDHDDGMPRNDSRYTNRSSSYGRTDTNSSSSSSSINSSESGSSVTCQSHRQQQTRRKRTRGGKKRKNSDKRGRRRKQLKKKR